LRRSASSIPSNIAEGCGRDGDAELARFCLIARGSASELQYQILLAHDLKLIPSGRYEELSQEITEIKRMKDKRNKRHVGSIRPAFDRFTGRITASLTRFMSTSQRELPRSADFFRGGRRDRREGFGAGIGDRAPRNCPQHVKRICIMRIRSE